VPCPESLRLQAYVDGEVDALSSADIERHLDHCAECRQLRREIEELRTALRQEVPLMEAPPALRRRIMLDLGAENAADGSARIPVGRARRRLQPFWLGAAGGFAVAAFVAMVAFLVLVPPLHSPVLDEIVAAHVNSLMSSHLTDVASTEQHTVKPWFAGRTEVSPAVADFSPQGFKLLGGRIDYLRHQRAAVVVYQHGQHIIAVYCWAAAAGSLPRDATRNGYHALFWNSGELAYAAVSDTGWAELSRLQRLLRGLEAIGPPT
jgi:anti-sigma factor RsiW